MIDLRHGCGIEMLESLPDASVSLILTDPPYERKARPLYGRMAKEAARVLEVGGSLVTLCGQFNAIDIGNDIREHLRFWWLGGMIHGGNLNRFPGMWVCVRGKPLLWFVKERRYKKDTRSPVDYFEGGGKDKRHHEWGQPVHWFRHWIGNLASEGGRVVDPFVGGGTVAIAAVLEGRMCVCSELDEKHYLKARERIDAFLATQPGRIIVPELKEIPF